ncbi:hypothetical protein TNCV_4602671 [Trichonephila clavipes]|nr:hypothetical protein TNCV_4602671 [Trichonephila clavipes]
MPPCQDRLRDHLLRCIGLDEYHSDDVGSRYREVRSKKAKKPITNVGLKKTITLSVMGKNRCKTAWTGCHGELPNESRVGIPS